MENLHDKQFNVSEEQLAEEVTRVDALEQASFALGGLIDFLRKGASTMSGVHYTLFGMLQASLSVENDEPDEWAIKSRLHIYDSLHVICEELYKVKLTEGQRFCITVYDPSNL